MIDLSSEFGQRVARRLREEPIGWLTTVDRHGYPQPRPVWFLWDGESFLYDWTLSPTRLGAHRPPGAACT